MKRLLFLTPGNNLVHLGPALPGLLAEQEVEAEVSNLLSYQVTDGDVPLSEVERRARAADVILLDIRVLGRLEPVLYGVRERDPDKTIIPLMGGSMDVLRLCRMGSFSFDRVPQREGGGTVNYRRIQQITALVDKLGGVLPVGALRHARNWVHVVRYWTAGGEHNVHNLLRLVLREYCGGRGPRPEPPRERPTHYLEHPDEGRPYARAGAYLRAHPPDPARPTVAVLHYGGMHRDASVAGLRGLIDAFAGRADVLPVATDGVQSLDAVRRFLLGSGAPRVDALISLLWFRLDGGPLGGDPERTRAALQELDVTYTVPVTLYAREIERWAHSDEGLSPVEAYATVVIPELDGALHPVPLLGVERSERDGFQVTDAAVLPDRARRIADRVLGWIGLARTPRAERRVALVAYDYPPGPASVGNASYLDVDASLGAILGRLGAEGYDTGGADDGARPLAALLADGVHNGAGGPAWRGDRLAVDDYRGAWDGLPASARRAVEAAHGPLPGRTMVDDGGLRIPGRWYGQVFVGLQPSRTPDGDDAAATHDRALPPHHQYLAFYEYLRRSGVHAVVHVGTHGTAEFTPGKELGLSGECFPDLLQGAIPQLYLYTLGNPSESSIARRRWQAALVSHHVPDLVPATLYGEYRELLDRIERTREPGQGGARRGELEAEIRALAAELDLDGGDLEALEHELRELSAAAIPDGLHVFGRPKDGRSLARYLTQLLRREVAGVCVEAWAAAAAPAGDVGERLQGWAEAFVREGRLDRELTGLLAPEQVRRLADELASISRAFLADRELDALVHGLDGGFLEPGLMGDALRSPGVYPTGRNGCAFDPARIPFPDAVRRGEQLGQALVERHLAEHGRPPETVALVLWGFETARSGGETLGQLLYLLGARLQPRRGWLPSFEPIPAAELGRPRVDVVLMICGFFRDMFPTLVRDLDHLIREIAALDEPGEVNPVRAHRDRMVQDVGDELAGARLFGPRPGEYGTDLTEAVERSEWGDPAELGDRYEAAMGHAYGEAHHGADARAALAGLLARTEAVSQVIDGEEYKIGDLDHYYEFLGGAARAVENRSGRRPAALVGDTARAEVRLQGAGDALQRYSVSRLLNPRWIDGMLRHDLHGGKQIEERVTNLVGLAGTVGVPSKTFDRVFARYIEDPTLFRRLAANNPHAAAALTRRLGEADRRGLWDASDEQRALLRRRYLELDAELEGE